MSAIEVWRFTCARVRAPANALLNEWKSTQSDTGVLA
jgi:hypothetical protein